MKTQSPATTATAPLSLATSRRSFLKTAGAAAAGFLILPSGWLRGQDAPSNRLNIAGVGLGGQGMTDFAGVTRGGGTIVALCDVAEGTLRGRGKRYPNAKQFADYRVMLDKMGKDIDAVVVSTPDHSHFTISLDSIQRGKHVYVQKPMCHSVDQCRRLTKAAADAKITAAMGNQGHSSSHIRMAREWFEAGLFGSITKVDCWDGQHMRAPQAYASGKVPEGLNWDLWLGPARDREFCWKGGNPQWRPYYDFGSGSLGDMAAHIMDPAYFILDLGYPEKIEMLEALETSPVGYPGTAKMIFHFPAKGTRGPVQITWWHGKNYRPKAPDGLQYLEFKDRANDENLPDDPTKNLHPGVTGGLGQKRADGLTLNGSLFYGEKVTFNMGQYGDFFFTAPNEKFAELKKIAPPQKFKRYKGGHYRAWVDAIRKNEKAISDFDYAGPLTEVICMGNIAQRLNRTVRWDAAKGEFINDPEANALLKAPPPRAGFHA